ncbi:MAG: ATP-binding protein [Lachnospiraceae bacterium]|nr:ATP-binding protein [Lachnospiraceae bacterium]MBQ8327998.1 ATP-binding protein [Lachnospiraceae bacterium]
MKKSNEVFIPGALPESTYITRIMSSGFTYEERLKQALSVSGYLTLISGPSKIGKTVLCEKVVGLDHLVEISGSDMLDQAAMWTQIGMKAGMPHSGITKPGTVTKDYMEETFYLTKESVLTYFKEHDLVLLMDDFHYASLNMQVFMAQQFKDAIRKGLRIVIASLPHRVDDTIRTNPDLQGRISIIDIQAWSREELELIPQRGFSELGMSVAEDIIEQLAKESIASPQLMQLICLNICILAESKGIITIDDKLIRRAFRFSTLNLDYEKVVNIIRKGKSSRGQKRAEYQTELFGTLDLYGLILEALALDPPFVSITVYELYERIVGLIHDAGKPSLNALRNYLKNLQDILDSNDRSYEVLEWKDDSIYILESLFLFYLRWGRGNGNVE